VQIRFVVPGEPRGKGRARATLIQKRDGTSFISNYTPEETRREESFIRYMAKQAMNGQPPLTGRLRLALCAYRPMPQSFSRRKRDAALAGQIAPISRPDYDNIAKMLDALKGIVWVDDAQITDAFIYKRFSDQPRLVVEVSEL
jgi:Holliday junction resolvase RusA-like endonuclease